MVMRFVDLVGKGVKGRRDLEGTVNNVANVMEESTRRVGGLVVLSRQFTHASKSRRTRDENKKPTHNYDKITISCKGRVNSSGVR